MSDAIGPLTVLPSEDRGPLLPGAAQVSAHTQEVIDEEVRRLVEGAYTEVVALLTEHRPQLDSLAKALLEHETLDEDDAYRAAGVEHASSSDAVEGLAAVASASVTAM
jgi:cell division protease FtsH